MKDAILTRFLELSQELKAKIKTIYLFGSRARGDAKPYSDYDLLFVVTQEFNFEDKSRLYDFVMDILLDTGRLVSLKIFKEKEFERLRHLGTPFTKNILREGVKVG